MSNLTKQMVLDGSYTELALALDRAMANDVVARMAYMLDHGTEWVSLCESAVDAMIELEGQTKSHAATTTTRTVR